MPNIGTIESVSENAKGNFRLLMEGKPYWYDPTSGGGDKTAPKVGPSVQAGMNINYDFHTSEFKGRDGSPTFCRWLDNVAISPNQVPGPVPPAVPVAAPAATAPAPLTPDGVTVTTPPVISPKDMIIGTLATAKACPVGTTMTEMEQHLRNAKTAYLNVAEEPF